MFYRDKHHTSKFKTLISNVLGVQFIFQAHYFGHICKKNLSMILKGKVAHQLPHSELITKNNSGTDSLNLFSR